MSDEEDNEYDRFNWLVPGKVAGAPNPELFGGIVVQAPFLREQSVGAIVSVTQEPLVPSPADHGFAYHFEQTENFRPPPNLEAVLDFMDAEIDRGHGVLVHCFAGIGRTGMVLASWLLRHDPGLSAEDAITRVRDEYIPDYAKRRFPEDPTQRAAIEAYALTRG